MWDGAPMRTAVEHEWYKTAAAAADPIFGNDIHGGEIPVAAAAAAVVSSKPIPRLVSSGEIPVAAAAALSSKLNDALETLMRHPRLVSSGEIPVAAAVALSSKLNDALEMLLRHPRLVSSGAPTIEEAKLNDALEMLLRHPRLVSSGALEMLLRHPRLVSSGAPTIQEAIQAPSELNDALQMTCLSEESENHMAIIPYVVTETAVTSAVVASVISGGAPTIEEANQATSQLNDALQMIHLSSNSPERLDDSEDMQIQPCLEEIPAAQENHVLASLVSDPAVWDAVMHRDTFKEFNREFNQTTAAVSTLNDSFVCNEISVALPNADPNLNDSKVIASIASDPTVYDAFPTMEEAKQATSELNDALQMIHLSPNNTQRLEDMHIQPYIVTETAVTHSVPNPTLEAFSFLQETPSAEDLVATLVSDKNISAAITGHPAFKKFIQEYKTTTAVADPNASFRCTEIANGFSFNVVRMLRIIGSKMAVAWENLKNGCSKVFKSLFGGGTSIAAKVGSKITDLVMMVFMAIFLKPQPQALSYAHLSSE